MEDQWIGKTITRERLRDNPAFYSIDGKKIFPVFGSSGIITPQSAIAVIGDGFLRTYLISSNPLNGDITIESQIGQDAGID